MFLSAQSKGSSQEEVMKIVPLLQFQRIHIHLNTLCEVGTS